MLLHESPRLIGRTFLAILLAVFCHFLSPSAQASLVVFQDAEFTVTVEHTPKIQKLTFRGRIHFSQSAQDVFRKAVARLNRYNMVLFVLDSGGGSVGQAEAFIEILKDWVGLGNVTAYVPADSQCASACLALFLGSDRQMASSNAKFGFHAARDHTGQLFSREVSRSQVQKYGAGQALLKALDKMGVFNSLEIQYLSGVEMHTLGSVQVLTENPMGLDCTNLLTSGTDDNTQSSL